MIKPDHIITIVVLALITIASTPHAQTLEPRAYANAPTGLNFLLVGYQRSEGALLFDPSLPVTDANADIDLALLGYVHTLGIVWQYRWGGGL